MSTSSASVITYTVFWESLLNTNGEHNFRQKQTMSGVGNIGKIFNYGLPTIISGVTSQKIASSQPCLLIIHWSKEIRILTHQTLKRSERFTIHMETKQRCQYSGKGINFCNNVMPFPCEYSSHWICRGGLGKYEFAKIHTDISDRLKKKNKQKHLY